ncbi:hypothetical protein [uncultured Sulfitobacter sp.]|uniref:hypothetical protein n=1 Tax=uncultured Sulfitobacter sp. TaxID=191468 RepID=UPI002614FAB5|nr:hypothetical protein [uncultured Sulfitobacter sp.]
MIDASSIADCTGTCSPKGSSDPSCGCAGARKSQTVKTVKFGAGFFVLCALCCAVPPVLIALGFIGITTGAYLSAGSTVALIVSALLGLGYLLVNYVKSKR